MSLKLMLEKVAIRYGGKTAIVSGERRLSYADLDEAANKVANTLIKRGVNKGDRVAMLLSNSPEFVTIYFGITRTGAIAVPLDTSYKVDELASLFDDCQPKILVAESPTLEPLVPALARFESIEQVIDVGTEGGGQFLSYREIMAAGSAPRTETEPEPDDIAHIAYTSGASFRPEGAMLTHHCLVAEAATSADGFQQTDRDVVLLYALPMYHAFGLVSGLLTSLYEGSTVVLVPGTGLSIGSAMAAVEKERATIFLGVPYIFALALNMARKEGVKSDLTSLRLCASAGAPLPVDTVRQFKKYYGRDILDCWGLTEATCLVTCPPVDGSGQPGSVGKALPRWEVKIVGDDGRELPPNRAGEIIVRGLVMKGYYNNPQATAEAIRDGWLHTGDIGEVDGDGYLFITGRKKDIIIVKGQNVRPGDIETVLGTHPRVAEAAVLGIPDELRGEMVGAVIKLKEGEVTTEQEIKRFCHERIVSYKVPKSVTFVDSLPRTAAGEIDKKSLRDRLSIPPLFPERAVPLVEGIAPVKLSVK